MPTVPFPDTVGPYLFHGLGNQVNGPLDRIRRYKLKLTAMDLMIELDSGERIPVRRVATTIPGTYVVATASGSNPRRRVGDRRGLCLSQGASG